MPATRESYQLAQDYRRQQQAVKAEYMEQAAVLWAAFLAADGPDGVDRWLSASSQLIERYRRQSWTLGTRYYRAARRADLPELVERWEPEPYQPMPDAQKRINLLDRSLGTLKRAQLRGIDAQKAEDKALANTLGSGGRMVADGSRSAVEVNGRADEKALGYMRVSDGDPCYFCAMLVSRGAVYASQDSAGRSQNNRFVGPGLFKFHDHCGCTVAPMFTRSEFISDEARKFREIWNETGANYSDDEARNAFRRRLEGRGEGPGDVRGPREEAA